MQQLLEDAIPAEMRAVKPAPGIPWPGGRSASTSTWPAVLLSMLTVAGLAGLLFLRNHRYYFIDDRISGEIPKLMDMGRILASGEWPWLSTSFMNGSAYAVEYAHGAFNPLNLALAVPLARFDDIALGAFLYILVHMLLLTAAAAWLGRLLGLSTAWTVAVAVSVGFQPYTVVWTAAAWSPGLTSFAWFVLAVAAVFAFHLRPRRRYGWLILLAVYGAITSGWPLVIPVLGLFVAATLAARLAYRAPLRGTAWIAAWSLGGVLCSMVAIYPLMTAAAVGSRDTSVGNSGNFNVAPLEGLLQAVNPGFYGFFNNFGGYQLQELPHFYVAWFLLPILVFYVPRRLPRDVAVLTAATLATLAVTAVGALGPERLLSFRFPTRFLQYYGFFLVVAAAIAIAHGRFSFSRRRLLVALGVTGLLVLNALQADPDGLRRVLPLGLLVVVLCLAVWQAGSEQEGSAQPSLAGFPRWASNAAAGGGTVALLTLLALTHPTGRGIDWGFPHELSSVAALSQQDYTLFYGNYLPPGANNLQGYREYHPSTMGLMVGDRQVNGYTALGNRFFREYFPIDDHGNFPPGSAAAFTRVDPSTGVPMLELFRVDQIISLLGPMTDELAPALGDHWTSGRPGIYTTTFRHPPYTLPGLVSYAAPGLVLADGAGESCEPGNSHECVAVTGATNAPGRVVFARLWFPGYRATLDGVPLDVKRHAGGLVSVVVPPGRTGLLEVSYRSPGFFGFGALSLVALVGLGAASYRLHGVVPSSPVAPERRRPHLTRLAARVRDRRAVSARAG